MIDQIDINKILEIAHKAGEAILEIYHDDFDVEKKGDSSPITMADRNSNNIIVTGLRKLYPDIPIISEESKQIPFSTRRDWEYFWMVDPLDGTKEFIKRNDEFTVNIALIHKDHPVLGVVYVPVFDNTYYAVKGNGSFKIDAEGNTDELHNGDDHYRNKDFVKVVASRSHLSDEVNEFVEILEEDGKEVEFISAGSSIKFCLVAEGEADVYPRFGPTMEWDTAAAQIVAEEAGRQVLHAETKEILKYNKESLFNPFFIVE